MLCFILFKSIKSSLVQHSHTSCVGPAALPPAAAPSMQKEHFSYFPHLPGSFMGTLHFLPILSPSLGAFFTP